MAARVVLVAMCITLLMMAGMANGNFLEERHRDNRQCSLGTGNPDELDPNLRCSFVPTLGVTDQERVLVRFGESDCSVTLRSCMVGVCYVIRDFSFFMERDLDMTVRPR